MPPPQPTELSAARQKQVAPLQKAAIEAQVSAHKLTKRDIAALRKLENPSEIVINVVSCVCVLLDEWPPGWETGQRILAKSIFTGSIAGFSIDTLTRKAAQTKLRELSKYAEQLPRDSKARIAAFGPQVCTLVSN